jgi:glycosyltransferase involved in cell wall biosynthesis
VKILWASDNPLIPTGYAQVTRNVGSRLVRAGIEFHSLGFQQYSMPMSDVRLREGWLNFPVLPSLRMGEQYGNGGSITVWTNHLKPDFLTMLLDLFMIRHLIQRKLNGSIITKEMDTLKSLTRVGMYFPFDSPNVYEGAEDVLREMHYRVAMSKFGKNLLKKETGLDSHYIPHGVDTLTFRRLPDKLRNELRKNNKLENYFVVGSVFRNQTRKMPTKLLLAFNKFASDKRDVKLLLHCDPRDPSGQNLPSFMKQIDLPDEKVLFTNMNFMYGSTLQKVNNIYNLMDIHALSTTGEGFGLPIIESQAVGVPNVVTDCTTTPELIKGHGLPVRVSDNVEGQMNTNRALADVDHMAECFQKYYDNRELLRKHGEKAKKFTIDNFDWERVLRMWIKLYEEMI